jgi:hypothetical protein
MGKELAADWLERVGALPDLSGINANETEGAG